FRQLHLVARLEDAPHVLAHVGVVVGDDDASLPGPGARGVRLGRARAPGKPAHRLLHVGLRRAWMARAPFLPDVVRGQVLAAERQADLELGPVAGATPDRDLSTVEPDDVADQRETDTRSFVGPRARAVHPVEALE